MSQEEKDTFVRDGLVVCRGWFSPEHVRLVRDAMESDYGIQKHAIAREDAEGLSTKLTLWWYFGDDTYSNFGRSVSIVRAVTELIGSSS